MISSSAILLASFIFLTMKFACQSENTSSILGTHHYREDWGDEDEFIGNLFCDGHLQSKLERPKIAYCLSGGARTLTDPRVYHSLRKNLIEALGGFCEFHFLNDIDEIF